MSLWLDAGKLMMCICNGAGKRYVLRQDQPTCLTCYEDKFANKCEKCEKAIGTDFKVKYFCVRYI